MTQSITVKTGARLHFGFLSCKPAEGRQFGGAGLMIDSPGFEIVVREAERFAFRGPHFWRERVEGLVSRLKVDDATRAASIAHDLRCQTSDFEVEIRQEIPPHIGLGSGTQLAMALAAAIARLSGVEHPTPESLSSRVARGVRSALGLYGFALGGFLIDAGKLSGEAIGTLAHRAEFPSQWRLLLVTPKVESGLSGRDEREAFVRLPPMPRETTDRLCRIARTELLPAVVEADIERFGAALFEYGQIVGNYFAPVQGGTYASRAMENLVDFLRKLGIRGVGQTSWGPTIFAVCSGKSEADDVVRDVGGRSHWSGCQFRVAVPRNGGAEVCAGSD